MYDFLMIVREFGPSVGLLILFGALGIKLVIWINKLDTKIKRHSHIMEEIKSDVENIHNRCHVPIGAVKDLEKKVSDLEKQDLRLDGDIKKIDEHMRSQDNSITEIKVDVKEILKYLMNGK